MVKTLRTGPKFATKNPRDLYNYNRIVAFSQFLESCDVTDQDIVNALRTVVHFIDSVLDEEEFIEEEEPSDVEPVEEDLPETQEL